MTDLEKEKEKLLIEINEELKTRGYFKKATCDTNSFGWNLTTHLAMHSLKRNPPDGMVITSKVNFEVTDWIVSLV